MRARPAHRSSSTRTTGRTGSTRSRSASRRSTGRCLSKSCAARKPEDPFWFVAALAAPEVDAVDVSLADGTVVPIPIDADDHALCSSTVSRSTSTRSTSCSRTARRRTATSASTTADTSSAVRAVAAVAEDPGWAGAWSGWSVVVPQYGLDRLRRRKAAGEITTLSMVRQAFVGLLLLLALAAGLFLFVTLSSRHRDQHGCGDRHGRGGGSGHGSVPTDRAPSELRDRGDAR